MPLRNRRLPSTPLDGVDVVLADLDGVVYRGREAVPHAAASLERARSGGRRIGFVTNNASRTDATVAAGLREFGLHAEAGDVVTSPQAAVRVLAGLVPPGSAVLVVGGDGLVDEVGKGGFRAVREAADSPAAVVQGFAPQVGWAHLAEAAYALEAGGGDMPWIATNTDWTLPTERGIAPGNGTLVSAVHSAVGRLPIVAGKPETPILEVAAERFAARAPLLVGDRLDTDILGAGRAGIPAVHVLTGVDGPKQLIAAEPEARPRYILEDLRGLHEPYPRVDVSSDGLRARVGEARVAIGPEALTIARHGSRLDTLRAACAALWASARPLYGLEIPEELYA